MRYYKLNNQYYSYNNLHNTFGYTYTPTLGVTYLLVSPWGDNTQTINGYSVPTNVYSESSYFVENSIGWFTLNQLSINEGYFPSNVESTTLVRNGETSNVVFLSFADEPRYLIEKDLSVGWLTEQEYTERGWGKGTGIILIDKTQNEETFIASLPEIEFITKDVHIPDIDKSLLELPIVPQIEFITKDVHIPNINKDLLEIPVPTSIELVKKSNLPDVVLFLSPSGSGFNNTYNAITNTEDINGNNILFSDIDNTVPIEVFYFNTSSKKTYTDIHKNQPTYIVNNNSIAAWKSVGYYGNNRVYYASYCNDQNAELVTVYKTPSYIRVPAYRLGSIYFILDGTHTSWVDDITVEGYTETPSQETCYVSGGTGPTLVNDQIYYYSGTRVYNNSGSIYRYNATKTYSVDSIYNKNGNLITGRTGTVHNDGTYITISVSGNTDLYAATVKLNITNLLPTVELFSVDGYKDYVYISNLGNAVSIQPNTTGDFYIIPTSGDTGERTEYDNSKIYSLSYWEYNEGVLYGRTGIDVISNSGWIGWRSLGNWGFLRGKLYSCDSTSTSVVTVYSSSDFEYNAFKFTLSGTDYYYVLDEVQTEWTNDLSSIGYSLTPPIQPGDLVFVDASGAVVYSVEQLNEIVFAPTGYFTIEEMGEIVFVEESLFPVVCIDEDTRTPENIVPCESFDTGLPYYSSKLYIITTNDGHGNVTRYGWECIARVPYYAVCGVVDSTSAQGIMVHVSYETFGVLTQDS